jgi:hypothetical protein
LALCSWSVTLNKLLNPGALSASSLKWAKITYIAKRMTYKYSEHCLAGTKSISNAGFGANIFITIFNILSFGKP